MDFSGLEPKVGEAINNACAGLPSFHSIPDQLLRRQIPLHTYPTFNLEKAVCNHGFFMMAPNKWDPATKTLSRPLRLAHASSSSVLVLMRHLLETHVLEVYVVSAHHEAVASYSDNLMDQVKRMLRISSVDENASIEFHSLYPEAAKESFGRLFRSPSLFEDIIKSVILTNCGWVRSLDMAEALCELEFETNDEACGSRSLNNFPSSKELASLNVQILMERCKLGYRAGLVWRIARKVEDGSLELHTTPPAMLRDILLNIQGIGHFVAANVSMCMGVYAAIPIDTETKRHIHQKLGVKNMKDKDIMDVYSKFAPYHCLAYWFEHVLFYESKFGKLSDLAPSSYRQVTSSNFDDRRADSTQVITESTPSNVVREKKKKKKNGRKNSIYNRLKF